MKRTPKLKNQLKKWLGKMVHEFKGMTKNTRRPRD
jgi:hypothetical protein